MTGAHALVHVPAARIARWVANFAERHGETTLAVRDGALVGVAADGSDFSARLPFATPYDGPAGRRGARRGARAAVRLGRAAGAQGRLRRGPAGGGADRGVQGRASGTCRAARRPGDSRSSASPGAATTRRGRPTRRPPTTPRGSSASTPGDLPVVTGGDRPAVAEVLADPRLRGVRVVEPWLAVADPRRAVLERAVVDALAVQVEVRNA